MRAKLRELPHKPGVYFYLDADGEVLYVGKAKDLAKRVRSYFTKNVDAKTKLLLSKAVDVDVIITRNEVEALLLENKLINQHQPQYNISLRESRRYAWIRVTDDEFPRIVTARNKRRDGTYYGPYTDGAARRQVVIALNKTFKLRTCKTLPRRVCLQYHIGNCSGPCEGRDTKDEYGARVADATAVLQGRTKELLERLEKQMAQAAGTQRYEEAKHLRDTLRAVKTLHGMQIVDREESHDQDIIAYAATGEDAVMIVLTVRRGVITKKREYRVPMQDDLLEEFLTALYRDTVPPKEILAPGVDEEQARVLSDYFSELAAGTVTVSTPKRGDKRRLLEMAEENARLAIERHDPGLKSLKDHLNLAEIPDTIDCFDVSTHQGSETVAACIRYRGGQPDPSMYRRFNIKQVVHDDFGAMAEAIKRRYASGELPDLIVVDGGKGQLGAAREALSSFDHVPVIALAKKEEEVFVPGLPFALPIGQKDPALLLLRRIRDATHRFVIAHHRGRRRKSMTESVLDHIQGIGPARKQELYRKFRTFENIKKASLKQLQDLLGTKTGAKLYEELHNEPTGQPTKSA